MFPGDAENIYDFHILECPHDARLQAKCLCLQEDVLSHMACLNHGISDAVVISEAPSDEVYMTTIMAISAAGAISTETLRAFTEDEYRKIVDALP